MTQFYFNFYFYIFNLYNEAFFLNLTVKINMLQN